MNADQINLGQFFRFHISVPPCLRGELALEVLTDYGDYGAFLELDIPLLRNYSRHTHVHIARNPGAGAREAL